MTFYTNALNVKTVIHISVDTIVKNVENVMMVHMMKIYICIALNAMNVDL